MGAAQLRLEQIASKCTPSHGAKRRYRKRIAARSQVCGTPVIAALIRLSEQHGNDTGKWLLKAGLDPVCPVLPSLFADSDEAQAWILDQLPFTPNGDAAGPHDLSRLH